MENRKDFLWVPFYRELAEKLLPFQKDRNSLIEIIKDIFSKIEISLPTLDRDNQVIDIDPFTTIALFNKSGQTEESRYKILSGFANAFQISKAIPRNYYVPTVFPMSANYFRFQGERDERDIDNLWDLFTAALSYDKETNEFNRKLFCKAFDIVIPEKYIGNGKLTMALFWIAPDTFMNLDSRSVWYLYQSQQFPKEFVSTLPKIEPKIKSVAYLNLCTIVASYCSQPDAIQKDFKEISQEAYLYSEKINAQKRSKRANDKNDSEGWYPNDDYYDP